MLDPIDYLFDRAFDLLPKWLQWTLIVALGVLLAALLFWVWRSGT